MSLYHPQIWLLQNQHFCKKIRKEILPFFSSYSMPFRLFFHTYESFQYVSFSYRKIWPKISRVQLQFIWHQSYLVSNICLGNLVFKHKYIWVCTLRNNRFASEAYFVIDYMSTKAIIYLVIKGRSTPFPRIFESSCFPKPRK